MGGLFSPFFFYHFFCGQQIPSVEFVRSQMILIHGSIDVNYT